MSENTSSADNQQGSLRFKIQFLTNDPSETTRRAPTSCASHKDEDEDIVHAL